MTRQCPACGSADIRPRNIAKRIGGVIGSLAGATGGASGILGAARFGFVVGIPMGPYTAIVAAIAAATLRGIVGATIGCEVGTALGEMVDERVLQNDACRHCGHTFRHRGQEAPSASMREWSTPQDSRAFAHPHGHDEDDESSIHRAY